ncbi:hypothetical protein HK101_003962 [Irineochytrium annulatum]|nr:hypothetical protein HK101_003962 [Irineochytrium annulatum]
MNPYHYYQPPPPPAEPLQLSLRVVADRVETTNRIGQKKSRIEFRRVVEAEGSGTFVTGPIMGKEEEPSLAEEITSVLETVAEDTGSATLSVTVRSFVDPRNGSGGLGGAVDPAKVAATSGGWYGGSAPCDGGHACAKEVTHDIWGYNVGPAEICPCGHHLSEGLRIYKLRKEVVGWVCSSSTTGAVIPGMPGHPVVSMPFERFI